MYSDLDLEPTPAVLSVESVGMLSLCFILPILDWVQVQNTCNVPTYIYLETEKL